MGSSISMRNVIKKLPVYTAMLDDYENLNKHLMKLISSYREAYPKKEEHTNLRAWRSEYDTHIKEDKFEHLIEECSRMAKVVSDDFYDTSGPLLPSGFWVAQYDEGEYARNHHHYPADWSAVYYIDVDERSAPIIFEDDVSVAPKSGMMVLFPGNMRHRVPKTDSPRTVAAMNLVKRLDILEVD